MGYEDNGGAEYVNIVYPDVDDFNTLDGGWYRVTVPDKKNVAVVVVDENSTGEPRRAKIEMSVGDVCTTISVNQQ